MIATIATVNPVQDPSPAQPTTKANPIEMLQKTVSASRLNAGCSAAEVLLPLCPRDHQTATPALHVGSVVHLILQAWNMTRWRKQAFELQRFKACSRRVGQINLARSIGKMTNQARSTRLGHCWRPTFTETPIKGNEMPEAVEAPVETSLSKYGLPTLIGVLDLVRAGGRIVDFKTSGKTPSAEEAIHQNELQLSCYSVLYREAAGKMESARELHHLVKTKTPKLIITELEPMDERQQVRLFKTMESYVEGVAREDFVPSPGLQCCGCQFLPNVAAGAERNPHAELVHK